MGCRYHKISRHSYSSEQPEITKSSTKEFISAGEIKGSDTSMSLSHLIIWSLYGLIFMKTSQIKTWMGPAKIASHSEEGIQMHFPESRILTVKLNLYLNGFLMV